MHCYFVLAGDSNIPVLYHVERVREGKSFMTRTVQARQRGKCIFTTTVSFVREGSAGEEVVAHEVGIPRGVEEELEGFEGEEGGEGDDERFAREEREKQGDGKEAEAMGEQGRGPFETRRMEITNSEYLWNYSCAFLVSLVLTIGLRDLSKLKFFTNIRPQNQVPPLTPKRKEHTPGCAHAGAFPRQAHKPIFPRWHTCRTHISSALSRACTGSGASAAHGKEQLWTPGTRVFPALKD